MDKSFTNFIVFNLKNPYFNHFILRFQIHYKYNIILNEPISKDIYSYRIASIGSSFAACHEGYSVAKKHKIIDKIGIRK